MPAESILITGITGYLGRQLVPYVQKAWPRTELIGLDRKSADLPFKILRCDLSHWNLLRSVFKRARPRLIFHCAGRTAPGTWPDFFNAHVLSTANLLEAIAEQPDYRPRVIVVSSAAEYGEVPRRRQPIRETEPSCARSSYGRSKACQTAVALDFARQGIPVIIARIFNILGAGQPSHLAAARIAHEIRHLPPKAATLSTGSLQTVRDFLAIDDVCRALIALAEAGRPGQIYNVCSGHPLPMKNLVKELLKLSSRSFRLTENRRGSLRTEVPYSVGDPRKIRRHTGWRPEHSWADAARDVWNSQT